MASSILLRDVPDDVLNILLKVQYEEKLQKKVNQYSLSRVIFKLIRDSQKKEL